MAMNGSVHTTSKDTRVFVEFYGEKSRSSPLDEVFDGRSAFERVLVTVPLELLHSITTVRAICISWPLLPKYLG